MNEKELQFMLQEGEGLKIEFKERFDSSLAADLVAFANAEGGTILLGVDDYNKIKGTEITNKLRSQVQDLAHNCDPAITIALKEVEKILVVSVVEGKNKPYKCKEGFFLRTGPNSQKLNRDAIVDFILGEGKVLFDEQINKKCSLKELNFSKFEEYLNRAGLTKNLPDQDTLTNLSVFENGYLNNAGIFFFAKKPCSFIPQAYVNCVRFGGTGRTNIIDRAVFEGNIVENIDNTIQFVQRNTQVRYEIKEVVRREIPEYPFGAIRETVINAVMHRNYFEKGATVSVEIFDNRIEISNPGGLPKGLRKEDFGRRGVRRNPLIADLLYRIHYVERAGTGIERIKQTLSEAGLPLPKIEFDSFFTVTLYNLQKDLGKDLQKDLGKLTTNQKKIIEEIQKNNFVTQKELSLKIGITEKNIRTNIAKLKKEGILLRVGPDKGGHWELNINKPK